MEILGKLFGSSARVKIMRLFLLNSESFFDTKIVAKKSKVPLPIARKELAMLQKIKLIGKKNTKKGDLYRAPGTEGLSKRQISALNKKTLAWHLDTSFPFLYSLQNLLINTEPVAKRSLINKFKKCGSIKLIIVSGVFIQNNDSRLDILVVGDRLKKGALENALASIEAEIGTELSYASFDTPEFKYRLGMYDKFIRDVLDYPHEKIIDKIGV